MSDATGRPMNGFEAIAMLRGDAAKEFVSYTEWWDFIESWVRLAKMIYDRHGPTYRFTIP